MEKKFNWDIIAEQTKATYRKILNEDVINKVF